MLSVQPRGHLSVWISPRTQPVDEMGIAFPAVRQTVRPCSSTIGSPVAGPAVSKASRIRINLPANSQHGNGVAHAHIEACE